MDTVYNQQDGPYIQTFIFENTGFMIGLLKQKKTAEEMADPGFLDRPFVYPVVLLRLCQSYDPG